MFKQTQNQYYSFNSEGIHFTTINMNYYLEASKEEQSKVFSWIEEDLRKANTHKMRNQWPWVVFLVHLPIYCCYEEQDPTQAEYKKCYSFYSQYKAWDELIHKYSVDLVLSAHKHSYERYV